MEVHTDKDNWFKRHKVLTVVLCIAILFIFIGVAASNSTTTTPNGTTVTTTASSTKSDSGSTSSSSSKASSTAKVGDTIDVGGSRGLGVTVSKIITPAQGADSFTTANAGQQFVAVELTIVNLGSSSYQDDANSDVSIVGSDNQTYTADFDNVSECTNFNQGQYTLASGQSTTGCVVFQIPDTINVSKVEFQTQSGLSSTTGEWNVN